MPKLGTKVRFRARGPAVEPCVGSDEEPRHAERHMLLVDRSLRCLGRHLDLSRKAPQVFGRVAHDDLDAVVAKRPQPQERVGCRQARRRSFASEDVRT